VDRGELGAPRPFARRWGKKLMNVAVLGASDDPEKYSNKAVKLLLENGHKVFAVNPGLKKVEKMRCYASLAELKKPIHTLTVYVNRKISSKIQNDILKLAPKRVIFNPGAENPLLRAAAEEKGIRIVEGCTLVMLKTRQFDEK
jgi:predicted CoA-binding protein